MPTATLSIKTILGTTRLNRVGDEPARWIHDLASARDGVDAGLLDLHGYSLPFVEQERRRPGGQKGPDVS